MFYSTLSERKFWAERVVFYQVFMDGVHHHISRDGHAKVAPDLDFVRPKCSSKKYQNQLHAIIVDSG